MKLRKIFFVVTLFAFALVIACGGKNSMSTSEKNEARNSIWAMSQQTLGELFKNEPAAKSKIMDAEGYAVFSDFGFKVMFMGAAKGKGVAVDNATQKQTYMKMVELQPGLGLGGQNFRVILIFDNKDAFSSFLSSGWEFGTSALASAEDEKGEGAGGAGALILEDGVHIYQLNEEGLIVGVSITGAKYYNDDDLN